MARTKSTPKSSASLGFEAKLWLTADKLRNNMDAAEYKHVVLGLIFLKYIAGNREEHRAKQPTIELTAGSEDEKTHRSVDLLDRVYGYFLTRFARPKGKNSGQFYTPSCLVRCLPTLAAPEPRMP